MSLALLSLVSLPLIAQAHIHTVKMKTDQILVVKTALGIATIIQAPETIQSAIIGDQSGFKLEYLDHAVTIKPLRAGARSNLYLQTENRRYDLRLETLGQDSADYVVYLKASDNRQTLVWKEVAKVANGKSLGLRCLRIGRLPQGIFLIDLVVTAKKKDKILPEDVWLKQGNDSKVINGLFLAQLDLKKEHPVRLGLTLLKSDLIANRGVEISLKTANESIKLDLPAELLWK